MTMAREHAARRSADWNLTAVNGGSMQILVAYASRMKATEEIAQAIATELRTPDTQST
jgi:flavorubredoxin